jgi:Uma2 family endonuclease
MIARPLIRRRFTPAEYLLIERNADTRSEFLDGEIYAMAGASEAHITINDNLVGEGYAQLKGTPCQGMSQNVKVPAGGEKLFAYPDYLIVCGEKEYRDAEQDVLINPIVIFEVLSPSTEQYDRTTKFDLYKQIETFREYVLIEQDRPRVEHWLRLEDGSWRENVLIGMDAKLAVQTASLTVSLVDLYDRIRFTKASVL